MIKTEAISDNQNIPSSNVDSNWDALKNYDNISKPNNDFFDSYNTGIKSNEDLEHMKPADQLAYLSSIIEAAETDTAYAYFEAFNIFENIEKSDNYSPLIRIIAKIGKALDTTDENYEDDYHHDDYIESREFGYSTIVRPEMLKYGILIPEEKTLNKKNLYYDDYYDDDNDDSHHEYYLAQKDLMNENKIKQELSIINKQLKDMDGKPLDEEESHTKLNEKYECEFTLQWINYCKNQMRLRKEFPALPKNKQLVKIASDAAATIKFIQKYDDDSAWFSHSGSIEQIYSKKGEIVNIDNDIRAYISAIHQNNDIKKSIEKGLNFKLDDISLQSQTQLLKFMTEANNGRFNNLCDVLHAIEDKSLRGKILDNFVAVDFGEDFGDALLDIASSERLSNDKKERVLDTINSCRESVGRITDLYTSFDNGKFAKEYARASNERLTDAVTVFQQIAKNGVAEADLDWAGKSRFDYNKAIEALEYEAKSLEVISGTLGDVKSGAKGAFAEVVLARDESLQRLNRTFYNFYSPEHGYVLLYTRPEGSHSFDPMTEYGKVRSKYREDSVNAGTEASISLIANPVDSFSLPNPFRPDKRAEKNPRFYDPTTMDKVSAIRLDREGRAPGMAADDDSRDPINAVGMVSVDLAAIGDRADTPSGKIARLLSVGGKLREKASGVDSSLNHNTRWFNQDSYGTAEGFRKLVGYVDEMALKWCSESKPGSDAESFTRMMKRNRGRKVRRVA